MTSTRRSQAFWQKLVTEVERGVAVALVAERHGVKPRTLGWWCWRLRREDGSSERPRLLPVVVQAAPARSVAVPRAPLRPSHVLRGVEVSAGEIRLRIADEADVAALAALVTALRAVC